MTLCKRSCNKLIDIVRGRTYTLSGLKDLKKLRSLTLRDLAGPRAGLDLSQLPISKPLPLSASLQYYVQAHCHPLQKEIVQISL